MSPAGSNARQGGFTYLLMLVAVIVTGIMAEVGVLLHSKQAVRENENELLFRGMAYQRAIESYYEAGKTAKSYPRSLQDLLKDPRYIHRRHIRKLYKDPMTGGEWQLLKVGNTIRGVASSSRETPNKTGNFPPGLESFQNAGSYSEWRFTYESRHEKAQKTRRPQKLPNG